MMCVCVYRDNPQPAELGPFWQGVNGPLTSIDKVPGHACNSAPRLSIMFRTDGSWVSSVKILPQALGDS